MKQLVIVGGGFAGMWAALVAAREIDRGHGQVGVTLVSRDAYLTVRPRLYEVFTEAMRAPLASVLSPLGIELTIGKAIAVDCQGRCVEVARGDGTSEQLKYDRLILAAGSEQRPLEIEGAAEFTHSIDTFAAAQAFDQHLQEVLRSPAEPGALTFVIVGAGFTGIELATEMRNRIRVHSDADIAQKARVLLVERERVVGPDLGANPRPYVEAALRETSVETRLGVGIESIAKKAITLTSGERIETATVIVTAGLRAHPIAATLNTELDRQGRLVVDMNLRVKAVPEVFAAGDLAHANTDDDHVALMSCQHAIPMGKFAGYNAAHDLMGTPLRAYGQPVYVTCLDLGEAGALFTQGWDRVPENSGAETKKLKQMINTQWIYPPTGTRDAILAAADIDAPWPPAV